MWFPHSQLVTNSSLFDTLNNEQKQGLEHPPSPPLYDRKDAVTFEFEIVKC